MLATEQQRLQALTRYEVEARAQGYGIVVGIDEAGRGPLAGPVLAAACFIPPDVYFSGIDDSKKLTATQRERLFLQITTHASVVYGIGRVSPADIDRLNIYQATIQAMLQAVALLTIVPDLLLVDGMPLPHPTIPAKKIVGGDALSQSIAAASIIAKVTRDRLMCDYDKEWPQYGFKKHKGYGTPQHLAALEKYGPCPIHRRSFAGVDICAARSS